MSDVLGAPRPGSFTVLRSACLLGLPLILYGCMAADSHVPPFARVPYEPISRQAIAAIALREWRLFGSRTDDASPTTNGVLPLKPERAEGLWQRVGEYWWIGLDHGSVEGKWTGKHDDTGAVFSPDRDGEFPWSAAFVSYVFRIAGAGRRFPYAPDHAHYIDIATREALRATGAWLITAERPEEYAPRIGDLICQGRDEATNLRFSDLPVGHYFPAHCSIVVDTSLPEEISVIGGNENDAVTIKHVPVTSDGRIAPSEVYHWLAVLRLKGVPDKNPADQPYLSASPP